MILLKKRPHLFLETPLAVMRLLLLDILNQRAGIGGTNGKRSIPALPGKPFDPLNLHPLRRSNLHFLDKLRHALRRMQPHSQMHVVCHPTNPQTFALLIANDSREVRMQPIPHAVIQQSTTILGAENNMDQQETQRLGHAANYRPRLRSSLGGLCKSAPLARSFAAFVAASFSILLLLGCNSTPIHTSTTTTTQPQTPRPTTPPPPFTLFHQTNDSFTLVTTPTATDDQISAILFQLRDAAHTHAFDALHIPQKLVGARDPMVWFHLYRGTKCAAEKYTDGKLPCGPSYHAAGDYTFGGGAHHDWDSGVLLPKTDSPTDHEIQLWPPGSPYTHF